MDLFTLHVEQVHIDNTRSWLDDVLHLGYTVTVNGELFALKQLYLRNPWPPFGPEFGFNNGTFVPDDHVAPDQRGGLARVVINDPMARVAFAFQLVNANNLSENTISGRLIATADQMAGIVAGLAGEVKEALTRASFWGGVALEAFATLVGVIDSVDCDGPVAVDQIAGPRFTLDALTDNPSRALMIERKRYPGLDSNKGCGSNSAYTVTWSLRHWRAWVDTPLTAAQGVAAVHHRGAVYAFGVQQEGMLHTARTWNGAAWEVNPVGNPYFAPFPVSAASFNDRLYVLGINGISRIDILFFTTDGGTWASYTGAVPRPQEASGFTTVVFNNRLYVIAIDLGTHQLRITSTDDLVAWDDPWIDIPTPPGVGVATMVAAAPLRDVLHLFAIYVDEARNRHAILQNTTRDGRTWGNWEEVERGTKLAGGGVPLDIAAGVFGDRIYIASRWDTVEVGDSVFKNIIALNFTEDAVNWSGWRLHEVSSSNDLVRADSAAALASVGNHLYTFAAVKQDEFGPFVWAF